MEINSDLGICQSKSQGSHIDRKCEEPQSISGRVFGVRALEEGDLPATNDLQKGAEGNAGGHGRGGFRRALPRHRLDEVDYSHLPDGFILALDYFG